MKIIVYCSLTKVLESLQCKLDLVKRITVSISIRCIFNLYLTFTCVSVCLLHILLAKHVLIFSLFIVNTHVKFFVKVFEGFGTFSDLKSELNLH